MHPTCRNYFIFGVTMKTSELTGAALDWAVAKCEPNPEYVTHKNGVIMRQPVQYVYSPSINWSQAGPIIEREKIDVFYEKHTTGSWVGSAPRLHKVGWRYLQYGPTPLIAAMRCYVASKLGDDVTIPKELK